MVVQHNLTAMNSNRMLGIEAFQLFVIDKAVATPFISVIVTLRVSPFSLPTWNVGNIL